MMNAPGTPDSPDASPLAHRFPPSSRAALDAAVETLQERKDEWAALDTPERLRLIDALRRSFAAVAERWAEACAAAQGLDPALPIAGETWLNGPYLVLRNLRLLGRSLRDISSRGVPRIPGPVRTRLNGQVSARVFPTDLWDRMLFAGVTAEVWMEPGLSAQELASSQALAYREPRLEGSVCLVLGAGNVSSIGPMDSLYKLFVEKRVVLYKTHPVNAYLGPLLEEGVRPLVERGYLRVVYGAAEEGSYLCRHPAVDRIHITGSHETVEAIVFGTGEEGRRRKATRQPLVDKPITSELGNVSPVIVLPGPWNPRDIAYHAENLATTLANNAGFNCNTTRVLIVHREWEHREALLGAVRWMLERIPLRNAYYPGAEIRHRAFLEAHPDAERLGKPRPGQLPWTLIRDLDPADRDSRCFGTEAFCGLFCETALKAADPLGFLHRAVELSNERLWGTLNATLIVHPSLTRDAEGARGLEKALERLRYGTVSVNHWAAIGYAAVAPPWGAFPGHTLDDIQSGNGVVHNTLMFSRPQKTVVRAPFRAFPKPVWFATHRSAREVARRLTSFETRPTMLKLPGIVLAALAG